ncbi:MAG: DUF932 domain-containing protein [Patescibacteria group bacterium]|jgi:phage/plasmid-like protein (TIGR03299 family)
MAHELEKRNGKYQTFYAGEKPWHGLGQAVDSEVTAAEAIRLAGLDWKAEKQDIMTCGENHTIIDTHKAVIRIDDQKFLGIVGTTYEIIQNIEAFDILDALVGEGLAMYNCAGSLFEGKRIFITCKLPGNIQIGPDKIDKYLVLATSHDGSLSLHMKWTPIRVVCNNTLSAAFSIRGNKVRTDTVSIRHTLNYKSRVNEARELLGLTDVYYKRLEETCDQLFNTPMADSEFVEFTKKLYEPTLKDDQGNLKASTRCENKRNEAFELFHTGIGMQDILNTKWAAYNAITEQVDHHRNYTDSKLGGNQFDSRMTSTIWGDAANVKKKALDLLTV